MIIRVYDTRVVETSNAPIATKHPEETAKPVTEAVRWFPVQSKSPAGRHEATAVATADAENGLPQEEESA